jgi:hypothetical protein
MRHYALSAPGLVRTSRILVLRRRTCRTFGGTPALIGRVGDDRQGMGDDVTSVLGDAEHGDHEDDPRA